MGESPSEELHQYFYVAMPDIIIPYASESYERGEQNDSKTIEVDRKIWLLHQPSYQAIRYRSNFVLLFKTSRWVSKGLTKKMTSSIVVHQLLEACLNDSHTASHTFRGLKEACLHWTWIRHHDWANSGASCDRRAGFLEVLYWKREEHVHTTSFVDVQMTVTFSELIPTNLPPNCSSCWRVSNAHGITAIRHGYLGILYWWNTWEGTQSTWKIDHPEKSFPLAFDSASCCKVE